MSHRVQVDGRISGCPLRTSTPEPLKTQLYLESLNRTNFLIPCRVLNDGKKGSKSLNISLEMDRNLEKRQ